MDVLFTYMYSNNIIIINYLYQLAGIPHNEYDNWIITLYNTPHMRVCLCNERISMWYLAIGICCE